MLKLAEKRKDKYREERQKMGKGHGRERGKETKSLANGGDSE